MELAQPRQRLRAQRRLLARHRTAQRGREGLAPEEGGSWAPPLELERRHQSQPVRVQRFVSDSDSEDNTRNAGTAEAKKKEVCLRKTSKILDTSTRASPTGTPWAMGGWVRFSKESGFDPRCWLAAAPTALQQPACSTQHPAASIQQPVSCSFHLAASGIQHAAL